MTITCSYFKNNLCRSCSQIETSYEEQISIKEKKVLSSLDFIKNIDLLSTVRSRELGFRNKAKMVVSGSVDFPILGIDQNEILYCPIHHEKINEALPHLKEFITRTQIHPYSVENKKGEIKGIILYYSPLSNEGYLRFVLRSKEALDRIKKHLPFLQNQLPHFKVISINIQPKHMAILEGEEEIILTETTSINHQIQNIVFSLSPQGFVQTNHQVATELYQTAASWVKELKINTFVEIFCGQGAFSFFCSDSVNKAIGYEINKKAVEQANETAKRLNKSHLQFYHEDAKNLSLHLKNAQADLLLVNPPRGGLQQSIAVIKGNLPEYVLYSSCSIDSLARDLKELTQYYDVLRAQIFDMFPHTEHFEILVLLKAFRKI